MKFGAAIWKTYLALWVGFRVFSVGIRVIFDQSLQSWILLVFDLGTFVPIVGFISDKPILSAGVWRAWFYVVLVWSAINFTHFSAWFMRDPLDHPLVGVLLAIPAFAAIYTYSRPNVPPWTAAA